MRLNALVQPTQLPARIQSPHQYHISSMYMIWLDAVQQMVYVQTDRLRVGLLASPVVLSLPDSPGHVVMNF